MTACPCGNTAPALFKDAQRLWAVGCPHCGRIGLKSPRKSEAPKLWDAAVEGKTRFLYNAYTREE